MPRPGRYTRKTLLVARECVSCGGRAFARQCTRCHAHSIQERARIAKAMRDARFPVGKDITVEPFSPFANRYRGRS